MSDDSPKTTDEIYDLEYELADPANSRLIAAVRAAERAQLYLAGAAEMSSEKTTGWQPIAEAPEDVRWVAAHAVPPRLGGHIGRTFTLPDGRWVVLKFQVTGDKPESYFILPEPPK